MFKEIALNIYNSTPKEIKVPELRFTETEDLLEDEYKLTTDEVIPNLKGMPAMDALMLLERMGLKVELKGTGKVIRQSIKKGSKVKVKQQILLELS